VVDIKLIKRSNICEIKLFQQSKIDPHETKKTANYNFQFINKTVTQMTKVLAVPLLRHLRHLRPYHKKVVL